MALSPIAEGAKHTAILAGAAFVQHQLDALSIPNRDAPDQFLQVRTPRSGRFGDRECGGGDRKCKSGSRRGHRACPAACWTGNAGPCFGAALSSSRSSCCSCSSDTRAPDVANLPVTSLGPVRAHGGVNFVLTPLPGPAGARGALARRPLSRKPRPSARVAPAGRPAPALAGLSRTCRPVRERG